MRPGLIADILRRRQVEPAFGADIGDANQLCGGTGLFEGVCYDNRDGLVIVVDLGTTKKFGGVVGAFAELAGIFRGDDGEHPRCNLGLAEVDRGNAPFGNGRANHIATGLVGNDVVPVIGIRRGARRFEPTIDPVGGFADYFELVDRIGCGGLVEFHGSSPRFREHRSQRAFRQLQFECVLLCRLGVGQ